MTAKNRQSIEVFFGDGAFLCPILYLIKYNAMRKTIQYNLRKCTIFKRFFLHDELSLFGREPEWRSVSQRRQTLIRCIFTGGAALSSRVGAGRQQPGGAPPTTRRRRRLHLPGVRSHPHPHSAPRDHSHAARHPGGAGAADDHYRGPPTHPHLCRAGRQPRATTALAPAP
jgi:hypothetical protein